MTYQIHPRVTPGRRAWLEKLDREGVANRSRGTVGCDCMRLGWTEWVFRLASGELAGKAEMRSRYGDFFPDWPDVDWAGEQLTDEGRRVLAEARKS